MGVGGGDEAGTRTLAPVAVQVAEGPGRAGRRRLGLENELAHQELAVVVRGSVCARTGRALPIRPRRRQLGGDQPEVDAIRVDGAAADRAHDLSLVVEAGAPRRTAVLRRQGRIVVQVGAADALRRRLAVVAAVRSRIARVGDLHHLVVSGLWMGGIHHATPARDLVHARAEPAQDVDEERRDDEARLITATLRAARHAAVRIARHLAAGDPRTGRVRVPAGDTHAMLAGRGAVGSGHRERRLRPGGERHHLPVGRDPREVHARPRRVPAVGVGRAGPETVGRRVGGASLLAGRALELVGIGDRLTDDDRLARHSRCPAGAGERRRRGGADERARRRGGRTGLPRRPRVADQRQKVPVGPSRLAARDRLCRDLALAGLLALLRELDDEVGVGSARRTVGHGGGEGGHPAAALDRRLLQRGGGASARRLVEAHFELERARAVRPIQPVVVARWIAIGTLKEAAVLVGIERVGIGVGLLPAHDHGAVVGGGDVVHEPNRLMTSR